MVDEKRKAEMREYQKQRSAVRRRHGLVTRTLWIWEADNDAFRDAISPYVDRARLIEAILGTAPLPSLEIIEIIKKHNFPYDPADIIYLADLRTQLALDPSASSSALEKARDILSRYDLPITVDDLVQ
ncbi:histidine kinase [Pararhodobacter oceanensis]|uniref:Histidine kinase n=1 Tax=Pararhodobacter oceanensis TaxID=2172121 RepID=A0A2T8HS88_9RHOB|nr:histidine kinase [Pararhodobacter oceanensis]PVH28277.1 histidine kinase [Pararhodobacter oceanensis]